MSDKKCWSLEKCEAAVMACLNEGADSPSTCTAISSAQETTLNPTIGCEDSYSLPYMTSKTPYGVGSIVARRYTAISSA